MGDRRGPFDAAGFALGWKESESGNSMSASSISLPASIMFTMFLPFKWKVRKKLCFSNNEEATPDPGREYLKVNIVKLKLKDSTGTLRKVGKS